MLSRFSPWLLCLSVTACGKAEDSTPADATATTPPAWARVSKQQVEYAAAHGLPVAFENSIGMRFVLIQPGTFKMGSPGDWGDESPQHDVTLTKPYYLSIWATTNGQYRTFVRGHDSGVEFGQSMNGDRQPVVLVSYDDAAKFVAWLNGKDPAHTYRLPTEAEREYATRAGTTTQYWVGDKIEPPHLRSAGTATAAVGTFPPNPWGLYELAENVSEWCADWYGRYPKGPVTDPIGPGSGTERVLRSGKYADGPSLTRSAFRFGKTPETRFRLFGFRVAASPEPLR